MKVLVLGGSGMAGHAVAVYLHEQGFDVDTLARHTQLDKNTHIVSVEDSKTFSGFLGTAAYDIVINCIGLLLKQSDSEKHRAIYINSYMPRLLENFYKDSKTKIIHLSTDFVFSGKNPPYNEASICNPETFYGKTKVLGELNNSKDLTLRLSVIGPSFNSNDTSIFNWFFQQSGTIQGYENVQWSGVTNLELAKGIEAAIREEVSGIYHFAPSVGISKYKLLTLLNDTFEKDLTIEPSSIPNPIDTTLSTGRTDFSYNIQDYPTMLTEMKSWISNHPELYPHYVKKES